MIGFIDDHRDRFGVEPICRVLSEHNLQVAPSGYYAFKSRKPSKRSLSDAAVWERIEALQADKTKVTSKVEGRPPVQKGTRRLSPDGQKVRQQGAAMNRLKQTGRLDDAVAVYLANQKG